MILDVDKAYAAGFFDGEGCVGIQINGSHLLYVIIVQKVTAPLYWLKERWGGTVQSGGKKGVGYWRVNGPEAGRFLEDVLPFAKVKREQAEVGIASLVERTSNRGIRVTSEEYDRREAFRQRIKVLNGSKVAILATHTVKQKSRRDGGVPKSESKDIMKIWPTQLAHANEC